MHSSQMCNSLLTAKLDVIGKACSLLMTGSKAIHATSSASKGEPDSICILHCL